LTALHAQLRKKGDGAYRFLSVMTMHTDAPFDSETEEIVKQLLRDRADALLAGRALQVLTTAWGRFTEFRGEILDAIAGTEWDLDGDYKLAGVICAGFYLANIRDKEILNAVLGRLGDSNELTGTRQAARDALLRAMGKDSKEIVRTSIAIDKRYVPQRDPVAAWAAEQLATS
jgi:hypothetical protein